MKRALMRMGIVRDLFRFLWTERIWWMLPVVLVLILTGALIFFSQSSAVAPFVYTLF